MKIAHFVCFIVGGLLYQGGRALMGLAPTWDTFFEVTVFLTGIYLVVHWFIRRSA